MRCRSVKSAAFSSLRKRTFGVHGAGGARGGSGVPGALDMTKHIGTDVVPKFNCLQLLCVSQSPVGLSNRRRRRLASPPILLPQPRA